MSSTITFLLNWKVLSGFLVRLACAAAAFGTLRDALGGTNDFNVPPGMSVVSGEEAESNPRLAKLKWPTKEEMQRSALRDDPARGAVREIVAIVREVIRDQELPADIAGRVLLMNHNIDGCDSAMIQFKKENLLVEVVVTSSFMDILVRDVSRNAATNRQETLSFAQGIIKRIFNRSEDILKTDFRFADSRGGLAASCPASRLDKIDESFFENSWFKTVPWWSNGRLLAATLCHNAGTASAGFTSKDWLSGDVSYGIPLKKGE
jgi:hypothetical protein